MAKLAERDQIILSFPNPVNRQWKADIDGDDVRAFNIFQDAMAKSDNRPMETRPDGFPTYEYMMSTWHPMNDTKYVIGIGSGGDMACTLASCYPRI